VGRAPSPAAVDSDFKDSAAKTGTGCDARADPGLGTLTLLWGYFFDLIADVEIGDVIDDLVALRLPQEQLVSVIAILRQLIQLLRENATSSSLPNGLSRQVTQPKSGGPDHLYLFTYLYLFTQLKVWLRGFPE
jgi:hypothetical protein